MLVFVVMMSLAMAEETSDGAEATCAVHTPIGEDKCNEARIGDGFTSHRCRWCRAWFGFGEEKCDMYANI